MLFAIPEELELQGVPYKEASQIAFQTKYFIRALDFPKNARKVVIQFCKLNSDLLCLLLESQNYLLLIHLNNSGAILKKGAILEDLLTACFHPSSFCPLPSFQDSTVERSAVSSSASLSQKFSVY